MRPCVLACLLCAGCSFQHGMLGASPGDDAPPIDAPDVDATDGNMECVTYSSLFDTCTSMTGTVDITLTPGQWTYSTDDHMLMGATPMVLSTMKIDAAAGPLDVAFVHSFTVQAGATLRVEGPIGDLPFGLAASGPVRIDGIVDLSDNGAGARNDPACGGLVGQGGADGDGGAGGGGGGAFQGKGGAGSRGNADGPKSEGGTGGVAIPTRPASPIGGCDGGPGGDADEDGGEAGDGGGAIYIASAVSIDLGPAGVIDAGGGGGSAGRANGAGGGGGGSGGMILLESKTITVAGTLAANGGGGGEGNTLGIAGQNGQRSKERALGGTNGDANGGDGGDGGADTALDGVATADLQNGGGGGGGGGAGFIAIACPSPATSAGTISPPFAAWP